MRAVDPGFEVERAERLELFPTCIWWADLVPRTYGPMNERMRQGLAELTGGDLVLECRYGYQTHQALHEDPAFSELVSVIRGAVGGVLDYLSKGDGNAEITGCWTNVSAPGSRHLRHTHPNNFLSGVYYVQVGEGAHTNSLDDPRRQPMIVHLVPEAGSHLNIARAHLSVSEGALLVFPARFEHLVTPNESEAMRISVSFNVMLRDAPIGDAPPRPDQVERIRD